MFSLNGKCDTFCDDWENSIYVFSLSARHLIECANNSFSLAMIFFSLKISSSIRSHYYIYSDKLLNQVFEWRNDVL